MYLQHFGLKMAPFSTTPDPRFFYPSAKHKEALACLLYAVEQRKGFALITGEVGAGKSMLCRAALERMGEKTERAMIVHSSLSPRQFFQAVCAELNIAPGHKSKVELIQAIRDLLVQRHAESRNTILLIDEAQNLSRMVLEEVRLLGNLETTSEKLLQILLVGQPELRHMIARPELRQLNQRITVKFHLGPLSREDTSAYVAHRLKVAGAAGDIVADEAMEQIYQASGGVPRLINVLCDQALLQAFIADEHSVSAATIHKVTAEMEGYYMDAPAPARGTEVHAL